MHDVIVLGAGPAGVSAAVYAKSRGLDVVVLEQNRVGGMIANVSLVTHFAGIGAEESGAQFASRLSDQLQRSGIEVRHECVTSVRLEGPVKEIVTDKTTWQAKAVILATGSTPRRLDIPGAKELTGKGFALNAARDGMRYAGKDVYVVGGSDGAAKEALFLSKTSKEVTMIHFEEKLGAIAEFREKIAKTANMRLLLGCRLAAVQGKDQVRSLTIRHEADGKEETITDEECGIFVYAGTLPTTGLFTELSLHDGYIPVDGRQQTTIPGVFAAGDICAKQVRQVATAVSDGAVAAINAAAFVAR
jgi:thioredoxin reductase (NADPH)